MTNKLNSPGQAARKIEDFLRVLSTTCGLHLQSKFLARNGQVQPNNAAGAPSAGSIPSTSPGTDPHPEITVELSGPDTPLLLARNGELLLAIEHIAAKILRLESEEHDQISFDAEGF